MELFAGRAIGLLRLQEVSSRLLSSDLCGLCLFSVATRASIITQSLRRPFADISLTDPVEGIRHSCDVGSGLTAASFPMHAAWLSPPWPDLSKDADLCLLSGPTISHYHKLRRLTGCEL